MRQRMVTWGWWGAVVIWLGWAAVLLAETTISTSTDGGGASLPLGREVLFTVVLLGVVVVFPVGAWVVRRWTPRWSRGPLLAAAGVGVVAALMLSFAGGIFFLPVPLLWLVAAAVPRQATGSSRADRSTA